MESKKPAIERYSISDISANPGSGNSAKDFHVFKTDEVTLNEKLIGRPVRSDHFTVVLILKGEAAINHNRIDYVLPKNSLFIITPKEVHKFQKPVGDYQIIGMGFSRDFIGVHLSEKQIDVFDFFSSQSKPRFFLSDKEAKLMENLLMLLKEKHLADEWGPLKNELIHYAFNLFVYEMASIVKKHRPNGNIKLTRREDIATSFIKILSTYYKEERRVQFYANALFITPKHLSKTLKGTTHKTCSEMIDEMVINEAKILLKDTGQSVGKVAEQLHFSDQFFFSKFFKRHTGINPSQYKIQI